MVQAAEASGGQINIRAEEELSPEEVLSGFTAPEAASVQVPLPLPTHTQKRGRFGLQAVLDRNVSEALQCISLAWRVAARQRNVLVLISRGRHSNICRKTARRFVTICCRAHSFMVKSIRNMRGGCTGDDTG